MSEEVRIAPPRSLQEIVGALLFASQTPLTAGDLRAAVKAVEPEPGANAEVMDIYRTCTGREIEEALKGLGKALDVAGCGFALTCAGGAYRLQTVASCGRYVRALLKLDRPSRLGRASLETLAIIAYRQPVTKGEVEEIRGVDVSTNVKTLMDLRLIRLVGKSELPGHPFLYGTTPLFLEHFGLASLQQLNELDPTLRRSDPKAKAASYRRPATERTDLERAADAAKAAAERAAADAAKAAAAAAPAPAAPAQPDLLAAPGGDGAPPPGDADDDDAFFIAAIPADDGTDDANAGEGADTERDGATADGADADDAPDGDEAPDGAEDDDDVFGDDEDAFDDDDADDADDEEEDDDDDAEDDDEEGEEDDDDA